MINLNLTCNKFFLAVVFSFSVLSASAANRYSVATGNWNSTATWSAASGGAPGASFPVLADVVYIENGNTITVTANAACASITFLDQATNPTLTVNATFTLTVSGTVAIDEFELAVNGACTISGGGSLVCTNVILGQTPFNPSAKLTANQSLTSTIAFFNISGNLNLLSPFKNPDRIRNSVFNLNAGTVTVGGSVTSTNENAGNVSTLTMATGAQTGTLVLSGATPFSLSGTGTNTITINGTSALVNYNRAGAQTVRPTTYTNLTLSGSGAKTTTGATVNGVLSMEGTATAGSTPTYGAAATLQYKGSASQTTGVEFPVTFSGTGGVIINNINGVLLSGSHTINSILTLTSGAFSLVANTLTLANGSNLSYGGGSLTGGATSNLTIGTGANITLNSISGGLNNFNTGRNITLGADLSLNGTLTLTAGTFSVGANTLTLNGPTIAGTPANLATTAASSLIFGGTTAGVLIPTSVVALNGLSIINTSIVTLQSSLTVSGIFNPAGAGLSIGANTLTLNGQINCGTLTGGATSNIIIGGAGTANLPAVTLNNLTINRAVTMCGNVTVVGTLTLTSGALSIVTYTLTFQTSNTPVVRTSGTITTTSSSNLSFGSSGNTGGNAFTLPAGTFTTAPTINNLSIYRTNSLTLNEQMISLNGILLCNGPLNTNGNLTLLSTAGGTALIDGSGTGTITGNVTMQRYLPSGFGYKYFSSPFQASTVFEFDDDMNLSASFPTFYGYDENRTSSGWINYTDPAGVLNPMSGYAVNFGSGVAAKTVDVTGVVNNGYLSRTLYNHDSTYTKGFNLVGNPYPSPIDWNTGGWTKTNIDNALYYFKAGGADEYSGTYSTYINGVSNDGVLNKNIIPSMQGFFVHVSNGAFPVTGTLAMDNSVRITDMTHSFIKSDGVNSIPLLRLTACFSNDKVSYDPIVIYFDEKATAGFDSRFDAFKLMNTDLLTPNLYAVASDGNNLSIDALPVTDDSLLVVPLGLKTEKDGSITFMINDISNLPSGTQIYLRDELTGADQVLNQNRGYNIYLAAGEYNNRFSLRFVKGSPDIPENRPGTGMLNVYNSNGTLIADISLLYGNRGTLFIINISGKIMFRKEIYEPGYHEFNPQIINGVYIVNFISGSSRDTKKIIILN